MRKPSPRYDKPDDWLNVRVWWTAKHRFNGTVHLAVSMGGGKVTRCGLRIYARGKTWKIYQWERHGNSPIAPTCGQCIKWRKYDEEVKQSDGVRVGRRSI